MVSSISVFFKENCFTFKYFVFILTHFVAVLWGLFWGGVFSYFFYGFVGFTFDLISVQTGF